MGFLILTLPDTQENERNLPAREYAGALTLTTSGFLMSYVLGAGVTYTFSAFILGASEKAGPSVLREEIRKSTSPKSRIPTQACGFPRCRHWVLDLPSCLDQAADQRNNLPTHSLSSFLLSVDKTCQKYR